MKRKLMTVGVAGVVILGGAIGVAAASGTDTSSQKTSITEGEAKQIVEKEVNGTIEKVEMETDDGQRIYDIRVKGENSKETDVDVNAKTGKIIDIDRDEDQDDESENEANANVKLSMNEATAIAKKEAEGKMVEAELDDGHYDFEFKDGNNEYEVKVHGQTGEVIEFEQEKDED
ncbi:PepSY domain-containing protein [Halobacillus hunanensis]|uniref:PepSY domain-containing protein n=1 Tax=Halobacillus hunanensis TaxID=578214 RepID=UPI0009A5A39F|nr:PepSY domain-containing protein [Halobacillus hunanensis]